MGPAGPMRLGQHLALKTKSPQSNRHPWTCKNFRYGRDSLGGKRNASVGFPNVVSVRGRGEGVFSLSGTCGAKMVGHATWSGTSSREYTLAKFSGASWRGTDRDIQTPFSGSASERKYGRCMRYFIAQYGQFLTFTRIISSGGMLTCPQNALAKDGPKDICISKKTNDYRSGSRTP